MQLLHAFWVLLFPLPFPALYMGAMSKKSKRHNKQSQKPSAELPPKKALPAKGDPASSNRLGRLSLILDLVAIVLSIFGVILWAPSFRPLVQLENGNYVDPSDPFNAPFTISNNGLFAVHDVRFSCVIYYMVGDSVGIEGGQFTRRNPLAETFERGGRIDQPCPVTEYLKGKGVLPIKTADITIIVTFITAFMHFQTCSRFKTFPATDSNTLRWMQIPGDADRCNPAGRPFLITVP